MSRTTPRATRIVSLATAYADQSVDGAGDEFVIPEDFATLDDAQLGELRTTAAGHFDAIYGDGSGLTDENLVTLAALTEGIEALAAEQATREAAAADRTAQAQALAARIRGDEDEDQDTDEGGESDDADNGAEADPASSDADDTDDADTDEADSEDENAAQTVVASGRQAVRVPMSSVRARSGSRPAQPAAAPAQRTIQDVLVASGEGLGFSVNTGLDWLQAGEALDNRLRTYNHNAYESANASGRHIREQGSLVSIKRNIPEALTVSNDHPEHVDAVLNRATDEKQLAGGSLVAAGGWCAPSETLYDLIELESRDGLLSLPEVGIKRGGLRFTKGPSFAEIFSNIEGFHFTEAQDEAGEYAAGSVGPKPCYKVDCPDFEEHRLDVDGLCITAGLLASKGYPEYLARIMRGALVAHAHRLNGRQINEMATGSTAVTMPSVQAGAAAPILTSIELQVEHYKYTHRLSRGTTLEAVFPFWVRGAIRADLARRQGLDLLSVTDAQINTWFASRGVNPQFVYNWQAIDGTPAASFTAYPNEVKFLLYTAGTWMRGAADLITIDSLYDSAFTATNDYTALFTEEGWFVAQRGLDSRVVGLTFAADGATHQGIDIEHDGTAAVADTEAGA